MTDCSSNTPATRQQLFDFLTRHSIAFANYDHEPVFTVEESRSVKSDIPGGHSKNLFVKDKAGRLFLICALGDTVIRLNKLHPVLGCRRLSFAHEALLLDKLGVTPGSVTLFALINDRAADVGLVLDKALFDYEQVNFHPLKNDASTSIAPRDMLTFARATGHKPTVIDFTTLQVHPAPPI